jgi:hypothetical protein
MRVRHTVICGLSVSTMSLHDLINGKIFGEGAEIWKIECFDFLYSSCQKHFSVQDKFSDALQMYIGLHAMYPLFFIIIIIIIIIIMFVKD